MRDGPVPEPVELGSARQPRRTIEACSTSGGRPLGRQCAQCEEVRNVVVSSIDDDPDNFESVLEEVGNDERVLSEETEVSVGIRFGGLDKWR